MRLTDELHLSQGELVEVLRPVYPAASKAAVSLAERTNLTGVQFHPNAVKAARAAMGRVKTAPKRVNDKRVTLWLTQPMLDFLHAQCCGGNINGLLRAVICRAMEKGGFDENADSKI